MIITIDGPAGTGKTTVAKRVAKSLGYHYFDTGAMYRAVTYQAMKEKLDLLDKQALVDFLQRFEFRFEDEEEKRYFANGQEVTQDLRDPAVTQYVSEVSAQKEVRAHLLGIQQTYGAQNDAVFEGRDLGTVVFPQAEVKIFLTARPAVRAERRYLELKQKAIQVSENEVLEQIQTRDRLDSTRDIAPLAQAEDAHVVDTSDLTVDEVIDKVLKIVRRK